LNTPAVSEAAYFAGACFIVQREWEELGPVLRAACLAHPLHPVELRHQAPARRSAEAALDRLENICRWAGPASYTRAGALDLIAKRRDVARRVALGLARRSRTLRARDARTQQQRAAAAASSSSATRINVRDAGRPAEPPSSGASENTQNDFEFEPE